MTEAHMVELAAKHFKSYAYEARSIFIALIREALAEQPVPQATTGQQAEPSKTIDDAPCHMDSNEASAWVSGYEDGWKAALAEQQTKMTDEELGRIACKGYDDYWTEDCSGEQSEAWTASAKAVLAALAGQQANPPKEKL